MSYYKSNALYDYIIKNKIDKFEFASSNIWQLVYGDSNCKPKLLVLVSGIEQANLNNPLSNEEKKAGHRVIQLSRLTNIPRVFIRFPIDQPIENINKYDSDSKTFKTITMNELANLYLDFGVPIKESSTKKNLNTQCSSSYHDWQRDSLGETSVISDIDLLSCNKNEITGIYELKRSHVKMDNWEPYPQDYANFKLLGNLLNGTNIRFKIVYNMRIKNPWSDNIETLKIFNVNIGQKRLISFDGIISLKNFIDNY